MIHGGGILIGGVGSASIITTTRIITIIIDLFQSSKTSLFYNGIPQW